MKILCLAAVDAFFTPIDTNGPGDQGRNIQAPNGSGVLAGPLVLNTVTANSLPGANGAFDDGDFRQFSSGKHNCNVPQAGSCVDFDQCLADELNMEKQETLSGTQSSVSIR